MNARLSQGRRRRHSPLADRNCRPGFARGPLAQAGLHPAVHVDSSSFVSRLCGMPDYDQRRTAGILQGDGRTINVNNVSVGP